MVCIKLLRAATLFCYCLLFSLQNFLLAHAKTTSKKKPQQQEINTKKEELKYFKSKQRKTACMIAWQKAVELHPPNDNGFPRLGYAFKNEAYGNRLLVHVGKTCGASVRNTFIEHSISLNQVHSNPLGLIHLEFYGEIYYLLRDPAERVASAYRYAYDSLVERNSTRIKFYNCFPTFQKYVEMLKSNNRCGDEARRGIGHVTRGNCFYVGGVLDALMNHKNVHVIETRTCKEDTVNALTQNSAHPAVVRKVHGSFLKLNTNHSSTTQVVASPSGAHSSSSSAALLQSLPKRHREGLTQYLEEIGEYDVYRAIISLKRKRTASAKTLRKPTSPSSPTAQEKVSSTVSPPSTTTAFTAPTTQTTTTTSTAAAGKLEPDANPSVEEEEGNEVEKEEEVEETSSSSTSVESWSHWLFGGAAAR